MTPPVIGNTQSLQPVINGSTVDLFQNVTISSDPGLAESVTITMSAANGTLAEPNGYTGGFTNNGSGAYVDTGSAATVTTDLQNLLFTPNNNPPGPSVTTGFTISDTDSSGTTTDITTSVVAVALAISNSSTLAVQPVADGTTITPFASLSISDSSNQTETVTIAPQGALDGSLTNLGSFVPSGGIYTETGSVSQVNQDLQGIGFVPTGTPGQTVQTAFFVESTDSAGAFLTQSATVNAIGLISGAQAGQATSWQSTILPFAAVSITDDPSATETVTITLSGSGSLSEPNAGGFTFNSSAGGYVDTGSAVDVTSDIEALVFTPGVSTTNSVTTGFTITDTSTVGITAKDSTTTVVSAAGPSISGTNSQQAVNDQATDTPFASVTLTDSLDQTESVTITLSGSGSLAEPSNYAGSFTGAAGVYTDSGSAAQITSDLQGLVFSPMATNPAGPTTFTGFTISASDSAGLTTSDPLTSVAEVSLAISGAQANQTISPGQTITPFASVVIADNSDENETLTVTLSNPANGILTNLAATASYDSTSGVYTDAGFASQVTADLQALVFNPGTAAPGQTSSTSFSISDADLAGATVTDDMTSVAVLSGPAITGVPASPIAISQFSTIAPFSAVTVADDISQTETLTVTLSDPTLGALSNPGMGSIDGNGNFTDSGSAQQVSSDLQGLVFIPATVAPGQGATVTFSITDSDTAGLFAIGSTTTLIALGGPVVTDSGTSSTVIAQTDTVTPFSGVTITDDGSQTETVTVTLSNPANGTLAGSGGGSFNAGVYTDSGTAAQVSSDLNGLVFTPTHALPGDSTTTGFSLTDSDTGSLNAIDNTQTVVAVAGPEISGIVATQAVSDLATTFTPFAGVTIADDASQTETVTITVAPNTMLTPTGTAATYDPSSGTYTDSGSAQQVTTDLQGLVFTPAQGIPGQGATTVFSISDTDSLSLSPISSTATVIAVAGPAISDTATGPTVFAQASTITPFTAVSIADDGSQTESVTVTLSNPTNGQLSHLGTNGSYNPGTGVYTDNGTAATVSTDLQGLVFTPAAGTPGVGVTTSFSISATDSAGLPAMDSGTTVVAVAGPAISGVIASQSFSANATTFAPFAGITITDDGSQTETVTVKPSDTLAGSLSIANGTYDVGSGVYTDTGTAAQISSDLQALIFNPTSGTPGQGTTTTFSITDTDSLALSANTTANVVAVAEPVISGTVANTPISDQSTNTPFSGVTIADDGSQTETVTVTLSAAANGALSNLGSGSYDSGSGVYTDTGTASNVTNDLRGLVFTPAEGTPGQSVTTTFTISDTDSVGQSASDANTTAVANSGPMINGTIAGLPISSAATVMPFAGVTITDDSGQTETVSVTLSDLSTGSLSDPSAVGSYDSSAGVYTVSGSATVVTTALDGLVFTPTSGTPGQSVTTGFTISDTDTAAVSVSDATTTVIALGGSAISVGQIAFAIGYQSTVMPFAGVTVTDDPSQTESVTVTLSSTDAGGLSSQNGGSYNAATGVYTVSGTAAAVTTALDGLVFTPANGTPGQGVTTSFSVSISDTVGLTATGSTVAVDAVGGPVISGTMIDQIVSAQSTISPFATITLADDASQTETVTITLSGTGSLAEASGHSGGFTYDPAHAVYTDSGVATAVTSDLQALVFTPGMTIAGQSATTGFSITSMDTVGLTAADHTTSVDAVGGPAISGTAAGQTVNDYSTISPFATVTLTDDASQTETVTVALSGSGSLSEANGHSGGFTYDSTQGVYTDSGLATAVTGDLRALVFTPAAVTLGQSVTTGFTISSTDTLGLSVSDQTTTVDAVGGPAISGTTANQTVSALSTISPFATVTLADDASQTETVTITLTGTGTLAEAHGHSGGFTFDAAHGIYVDSGSATTVTADLDALVFTPATGSAGHSVTTGFSISSTDTAGLSVSDHTTTVDAVGGPAISGTMSGQVFNGYNTADPFAGATIGDDAGQTETVTITLTGPGSLTEASGYPGGFSFNLVSGVYTDSGTTAQVNNDLQALVFTPEVGSPGVSITTGFSIGDTDTIGLTAADSTTSVVAVGGPGIGGTVAHQTISAQSTTFTPFANAFVSDDPSQVQVLKVRLSSKANGSLASSGGGNYNSTTGVYTVTGSADYVSNALEQLVFTPASPTPGQGVTTSFTITDTDTLNLSPIPPIVTTVDAVGGPAISGTTAATRISDLATSTPFAGVGFADDHGQTEAVSVTLSNKANGSLSSTGGGSYNSNTGVYTVSGSTAHVSSAVDALVFTPAGGVPGQGVNTTFTITATDSAALSASDSSTTVDTVGGPLTSGTMEQQQIIGDQATVRPLANVTLMDDPSQIDTVTVTLSNKANGRLASTGGSYDPSSGVYTVTGSAAVVTAALDSLVFTPAAGTPDQSVLTGFAIGAVDGVGLTATDFNTEVNTLGGPAITGTVAGQAINDHASTTPFANVAIADDASQNETLIITLSAPQNGSLATPDGGSYDASTGAFTVSGSAASVTAAVDGLVFTPAAGTPGQSVPTVFGIAVIDSAGVTATDNTTSVVTTTPPLDPAPDDFFGNGTSGILVTDTTGDLVDWPVASGTLDGSPTYIGTALGGWSYVTTGDFNGDGTTDVLVSDTQGDMADWTVRNGTLSGTPTYVGTALGGWHYLATGDFNGDGTTDLLVTDSNFDLVDWTIKNGTLSGAPAYIGTATDGWKFLATGDFYGNGTTGILLQNAAGDMVTWNIQNDALTGSPQYVGTATNGWHFLATGDFYGNGTSSLLLGDGSGDMVTWNIQQGTLSGAPVYVGSATNGWSFLGTGDFNSDGTTDILVKNSAGSIVDWTIRNGTLSGSPTFVGSATNGWHAVANLTA